MFFLCYFVVFLFEVLCFFCCFRFGVLRVSVLFLFDAGAGVLQGDDDTAGKKARLKVLAAGNMAAKRAKSCTMAAHISCCERPGRSA